MKKSLPLLSIVALGVITALAQPTPTGNGAPSGPHYDLNIIGVPKGKNPPLTSSDRHTIFVPLVSDQGALDTDTAPGADIFLTQGPFTVCDGNAFDAAYDCSGNQIAKQGAVFQLPCNLNVTTATGTTLLPCPTTAGAETATYSVWARPVGTPGGSSSITTCATDTTTGTLVCSVDSNVSVFIRKNGKPVFSSVTNQLTSIVTPAGACTTGTITGGTCTVSLFAAGFQGFFWDYDNNKLKVLQLRFYLQ
jgi:hypothetical protein